MEGKGAARPPWLGFAVHVYNSIAAWADLLLARPRTFRRAQPLRMGLVWSRDERLSLRNTCSLV